MLAESIGCMIEGNSGAVRDVVAQLNGRYSIHMDAKRALQEVLGMYGGKPLEIVDRLAVIEVPAENFRNLLPNEVRDWYYYGCFGGLTVRVIVKDNKFQAVTTPYHELGNAVSGEIASQTYEFGGILSQYSKSIGMSVGQEGKLFNTLMYSCDNPENNMRAKSECQRINGCILGAANYANKVGGQWLASFSKQLKELVTAAGSGTVKVEIANTSKYLADPYMRGCELRVIQSWSFGSSPIVVSKVIEATVDMQLEKVTNFGEVRSLENTSILHTFRVDNPTYKGKYPAAIKTRGQVFNFVGYVGN